MDFDDVRLKEVDELTDEDKKVLSEHAEELTDDEKEIFKEILTPNSSDDDSQGEGKGEKDPEADKGLVFKDKAEFETAVAEAATKALDAREQARADADKAKIEEGEAEVTPDFFPKDYKATDWNEAFKTAAPKLIDEAVKKIQTLSTKQRERFEEVNKVFDEEIETLAKTDTTIPKKGTPERTQFDSDLAQIGVDYKQTTMTDSYKIYSALKGKAVEKKSEDKDDKDVITEDQNVLSDRQKALAAKIGKSSGEGGATKGFKYSRLSQSMDDLLEQELEKAGIDR